MSTPVKISIRSIQTTEEVQNTEAFVQRQDGQERAQKNAETSLQTEDDLEVEQQADGIWYDKGDTVYICYEMVEEDQHVQNRIVLRDNRLELHRKGSIRTVMEFAEGARSKTNYATPYGCISLEIVTQMLRVEKKGTNECEIALAYRLETDGSPLSFCNMQIQVQRAENT